MPSSYEDEIARLRRCEDQPDALDTTEVLRSGLKHRSNLVAQRAARIAEEQRRDELQSELLQAYQRFLRDPTKKDPGCVAKTAIVKALREIEFDDFDFVLAGIKYRQPESGFGQPSDAAAELRVICCFALAELGYAGLSRIMTDLLADQDKTARAGAARVIAWANRPESEPLLRLKVHLGDEFAEVLGECFQGLLKLAPDDSIPLVVEKLNSQQRDVAYEAAIALGESRQPAAIEPLKRLTSPSLDSELQRAATLALALTQHQDAIDHLFSLVSPDDLAAAKAAISALRHCRDQEAITSRLNEKTSDLGHKELERHFREEFR